MGGKIRFIMSIYNPEKAFEASFKEAVEEAKDATDLPTFMGTPETWFLFLTPLQYDI